MLQVLFRIPIPAIPGLLPNGASIPVFSYGTMIALGFFLAYLYTSRLARLRGIDDEDITDIFLVIIISSLVGSRINYVALRWHDYVNDPVSALKLWEGGLVFLGGFVGAMVGALAYLGYRRLPIGPYVDMFGPAVPFAAALGRVGCLMNGCCFGVETDLPWALSFPAKAGAIPMPRHPTQAYEAIALLSISAALHWYYKRNQRPGMVMVWFAYLYSIERFLMEFLRAESLDEHFILGTTLAQSTCMVVIAAAAAYHLHIVRTFVTAAPPAAGAGA
ncbi:MAG: prolipoprotein diacylglyceryl transferase, partial [Candidatus Riflebacteria bacterium]|nr:prolipoprotein diacylglyceryl transferase [Candidatus Riflebacteria bacterium]